MSIEPNNVEDQWRVGIVPTGMLSWNPAVLFKATKGINSFMDVGLTVGYVIAQNGGNHETGPVLRPEVRVFVKKESGMYVGLSGDFTWTTKRISEYVGRFGQTYQQFYEYEERNRYLGAYILLGHYMDYGKFGIDVGLGLGAASHFVRYTGLPDDIESISAPEGIWGSRSRDVEGHYGQRTIVRCQIAVMYEL